MKTPEGKTRLEMIKEGFNPFNRLPKKGRFIVSIAKIVEDPENERRTFRDMEGLISSVRQHGIVEPITVEAEDDIFRIITGHRRYRAAKAVGLTEIEVIARDPEDPLTRRRKSIVSNVQREDIGVIEMAEALHSLLEQDESILSQRQLAAEIGKSEQWVSDLLQVLRLSAQHQEKLRTSVVSVPYDSAMRIARCDDGALREELVEAALKGESARGIRRIIAERRSPKPAENERGEEGESGPETARTPFFILTETHEGCTVTARGPEGKEGRRHMRTALERLLRKI